MSKSLGNTVEPQEVIKESGAEILRLWVAMVDYREEVRVGKEILARVVEAYRKLRNTCRYPRWRTCTTSIRPSTPCRRALWSRSIATCSSRYADVGSTDRCQAYDAYDFQSVFQALNTLATVDLSAFYVDVSKDRLYTFARAVARAAARRRR